MSTRPITVTPAAADRVRDLMTRNGPSALGLRVGVKTSGCTGLTYVLEFATEKKPDESVFEDKGVKLFVDAKSLLFLGGLEMDVREGKAGQSFVFNDPA
ncbi:MAG: iron-sulfur cluster assembly accessory protein [Alphaproteobacteria bacterium]|nr:iron-sulfur cluster assembly accessory protein [Alphaproteobacteria bacterium]MBF0129669.1 iron-sulfur cluster assembly accessory protein [Alphaproteobacteria bacterium]